VKPVSDDYINNIIRRRRFAIAELYTFILTNGDEDYFTSLDFDLFHSGHRFKGKSLIIEGLHYKYSPGWNADEQTVRIIAGPTDTLAGGIFIQNVLEGLLDHATLIRQRAFWPQTETVAMMEYTNVPQDVITLYTGEIASIERIGRTAVELKVESPMAILDIDMPRNTYQPGCQWSLFDQGCGLNRADYLQTGTVGAVFTGDWGFEWSGGVPIAVGEDTEPYYLLGRLHFTSGANDGLTLSVRTNTDTGIYYMYPPVNGVEIGDTFEIWPGCAKTLNACGYKFGNTPRFRGFPRVPPIHITA